MGETRPSPSWANGRYGKSKLKLPFLSTVNCTAQMETVTNMKAKYNEM
jgi:hypothetical protein